MEINMDINQEVFNKNVLNLIDYRIKLRFIKEKRTSRTYIEGLDKFFDIDSIKSMMNTIKKTLSTGYYTNTETKGIILHGFNGDHKERIKKILVENYNISIDKIIMTS